MPDLHEFAQVTVSWWYKASWFGWAWLQRGTQVTGTVLLCCRATYLRLLKSCIPKLLQPQELCALHYIV